MSSNFYKTPLALGRLLAGQDLAACNLHDSITQSLQRIITTKFGEHRFDSSYGCEIWELDFELIVSESIWEEKLRQSMITSIAKHEQRLSQPTISVRVMEVPYAHYSMNNAQIKKQVDIKITGTIIKTGEPFVFQSKLFLSPLSVG